MIYDLILILIFIVLIIINTVRGAAKALAGIIVSVAAYLGATYLGKLISVWIYDSILKPPIDKAVFEAVNNAGGSALSGVSDSVPSWLAGILKLSGVDLNAVMSGQLSSTADAAVQAVDSAVRPAAVGVMSCILTIILFLLLYLVLRLIVIKPLLSVFKLPFINFFNRLLGGVIGFADAFLLVSLLAYILKLIIPYVGSNSGILNESTIFNSYIFYHFYSGNVFSAVVSWIGL